MSSTIWASKAPADSSLADGFALSDLCGDGDERLIQLSHKAQIGSAIEPDELPRELWGQIGDYRRHRFPDYWPEITYYSGVWIISGTVAAILGKFDLGGGTIAPVRRFEPDHATPVVGEWFAWNVGTLKTALKGEASKNLIPVGSGKFLPIGVGDYDLRCSASGLAGADVWFDPQLPDMLFLSGPLGTALIDAGLATEKAGFGELIACLVEE